MPRAEIEAGASALHQIVATGSELSRFEKPDRGAMQWDFLPAVAWAVIHFQQTREFIAIEPPPTCVQAVEKFEFVICENRHEKSESAKQAPRHRVTQSHYIFCIPAYCLPL